MGYHDPLVDLIYLEVGIVILLFLAVKRMPKLAACGAVAAGLLAPFLIPPQSFSDLYNMQFFFSKSVPVALPNAPATYQAVEYTRTGMALGTRPFFKTLKEGQVLVQIHSAAINPVDVKLGPMHARMPLCFV